MPDFGPDGLAGLNLEQRQKLFGGAIILPESITRTANGKTMIQAALFFERPPQDVWQLLVRTEDQIKYLDHVEKIEIIRKSPTEDTLEFTTKIMMKTLLFRICHEFDDKSLFIRWTLDPTFKNDLKELQGFWRLYPHERNKTIGRYGSRVTPGFPVPRFIFNALVKDDLRQALASVKKYVDSGGVWNKGLS